MFQFPHTGKIQQISLNTGASTESFNSHTRVRYKYVLTHLHTNYAFQFPHTGKIQSEVLPLDEIISQDAGFVNIA